jgi:hypothetical protein
VPLQALTFAAPAVAAGVAWQAPADCVEARATIEEAERLLGRPLSSVDWLDFDIVVTHPASGWSLTLGALDRRTGVRRERVLSGSSCDEVTKAGAVALAMVVDGGESTPEQPPVAEPEPIAAPEAAMHAPAPRAKRATKAASASHWRPAIWLGGAGDVGALPEPSPGGEVGFALGHGVLRLEALGAIYLSGEQPVVADRGGEFQLTVASVQGCGRWQLGRLAPMVCLGAELGRLWGRGVGVDNPRSGESVWWAPRADAGALWGISRGFSLLGRLGLVLPQVRREFVLYDGLLVHRPGALDGRLAFGLEWAFE